MLKLDKKLVINSDVTKAPNLCDRFTKEDLVTIGSLCQEGYRRDLQSRVGWQRRMTAAMDLAMQMAKNKTFPWPNSSNIVFPLVTMAALQFSARSYGNIIQGKDVVRYQVVGEDPSGECEKRAGRIGRHMSWQCLEEDKSWEEQHDRLLINLCIMGSNFIKTWHNSSLGHDVSELVMAQDFVLDYHAKSVEECARKTHRVWRYRNEVYERVQDDLYVDVRDRDWFNNAAPQYDQETGDVRKDKRAGVEQPQPDQDAPYQFLEQHRFLDLDCDGYAEPYIVTTEASSGDVVRLVARWDRDEDIQYHGIRKKEIRRIDPTEAFTKYTFIPSPDGGIYDLGFGQLLGPINEGVNTGLNQLFDAGTMANCAGGFVGRGAKMRGGAYTMGPWEWRKLEGTGDDIRKSLFPLPVREPSNVLFALISFLVQYTDRVAGTTEIMTGSNPGQNTKVGTYQGMVEQGMQIYTSIFKRVWRSMKGEFKRKHTLNAMNLPDKFLFGESGDFVLREDYKSNPDFVVPVADPNVVSKSQRIALAGAIAQRAQQVPGYDKDYVELNLLKAMEVNDTARIFPGSQKMPPPQDPKVMLEQAKLQLQAADLKQKQTQFALTLMDTRELNKAKIIVLKAQAAKFNHDAGMDAAGHQLAVFEAAIEAYEAHNQAITERITALMGSGEGEGNGESGTGGANSGAGAAESGGDGTSAMAGAPDDGAVAAGGEELPA